jgi:hypothetical protein
MSTTSARSVTPAVKVLAGIAVVAAGLAGCASRATTTAAGSGVAASSTDSNSPGQATSPATTASPSTGSTASPTQAPTPTVPPSMTSGAGAPPSAGEIVKYVSPEGVAVAADGKTLSTPIEWGGCQSRPQLIALTQDSTKVVVEVKETSHAGGMCPDHIVEDVIKLVLDAPLGSRQLVDGVSNAPIHVG